jgi:hypothetical protein
MRAASALYTPVNTYVLCVTRQHLAMKLELYFWAARLDVGQPDVQNGAFLPNVA